MADRKSAEIWGIVFRLLAENPNQENKDLAKKLVYYLTDYDFSYYQMDADAALISLGLAVSNDPDDIEYLF